MTTPNELLNKEIAVFEAEIAKATNSVYGVLISHLYVEHLLDRYIRTKIQNDADLLGRQGLSFSNKLKLVRAFGDFDDQLINAIAKLNSIRNDCAHKFGHKISADKVKALGRTLGKDYKRILQQYPTAEVGGIAPIVWNISGQVLALTLAAEGRT